jgi:hypothetical protein
VHRLRTCLLSASHCCDGGVDAFIDCFGGGYVDVAVDQLGVEPDRVDTIIDREAAGRHGSRTDGMSTVKDVPAVIRQLASLIEQGELVVPQVVIWPILAGATASQA